MSIAIICCIYNAHKLVERCIQSVLSRPMDGVTLVCVDNHSPDHKSRDYVRDLFYKHKIALYEAGKNLGCHEGWNAGVRWATEHFDEFDYLVKLDDDTEILTDDWAAKMTAALRDVKELGYVSADINAKQANRYSMRNINGHDLEVAENGVVGFSFVMFRADDIQRWGPMKTGPYRAAGGKKIAGDRLYGGEEVYYAEAARGDGKIIAHMPGVRVYHMDNADRHPDFAFWKRSYGYHGWTDKPMEKWIADGDHIDQYAAALAQEMSGRQPNEVLMKEWSERLGQIAGPKVIPLLEHIPTVTKNEVVIEAVRTAIKSIGERASA